MTKTNGCNRQRKHVALPLVLAGLLAMLAACSIASSFLLADAGNGPGALTGNARTSDPPINVDGDGQLHGVADSGTGYEHDPYVITGRNIDAGGSGRGISIRNTNSYLIIEWCTVTGGGDNWNDAGIWLENVQSVTVRHSSSTSNGNTGIAVIESIYVYLFNCTATSNYGTGVSVVDSFEVSIGQVTASQNSIIGIQLLRTEDSSIVGSTASNNVMSGIELGESEEISITTTTANNNGMDGIRLALSESVQITGNTVSSNMQAGIRLAASSRNTVRENTVLNNQHCILDTDGGVQNTIEDNNCGTQLNGGLIPGYGTGLLLASVAIGAGAIAILAMRRQRLSTK